MKKMHMSEMISHWTKQINDSMDDNYESGDGQIHVFKFNDDSTYEQYVALMPDGYSFFIGGNGGVGSFDENPYSYSTQDEMDNEFDATEIFEFPSEVIKGLKHIASNYYYSPEDKDIHDFIMGKVESLKRISENDTEETIKKALNVIRTKKTANTTTIRRALGLGNIEVAKIMDTLEDRGYVGPARGAEPRKILFDISKKFEWE